MDARFQLTTPSYFIFREELAMKIGLTEARIQVKRLKIVTVFSTSTNLYASLWFELGKKVALQ